MQACTGFVKKKYGEVNDIVDLNWFLVEESRFYNEIFLGRLNEKNMPKNLLLQLQKKKV